MHYEKKSLLSNIQVEILTHFVSILMQFGPHTFTAADSFQKFINSSICQGLSNKDSNLKITFFPFTEGPFGKDCIIGILHINNIDGSSV